MKHTINFTMEYGIDVSSTTTREEKKPNNTSKTPETKIIQKTTRKINGTRTKLLE